jgi:hypothetical protein
VCSKVLNTLPEAILGVDPAVLGRLGVLFVSGTIHRLGSLSWIGQYR